MRKVNKYLRRAISAALSVGQEVNLVLCCQRDPTLPGYCGVFVNSLWPDPVTSTMAKWMQLISRGILTRMKWFDNADNGQSEVSLDIVQAAWK